MIAIGRTILREKPDIDALVATMAEAEAPWQPAVLAAIGGKVALTLLQRDEPDLPRHVLKDRGPRLVLALDIPLASGLSSPGPSSWPGVATWRRLRPAAVVINSAQATVEMYAGAVAVAIEAGPVLGITCSPDRVADWHWLVKPWCRTVVTHNPDTVH